jgi:hypothetical protein
VEDSPLGLFANACDLVVIEPVIERGYWDTMNTMETMDTGILFLWGKVITIFQEKKIF